MIELFEFPPTRSQRVKWALEELGVDYVSRMINLQGGEQNETAYRAVHPLGVVPALRTPDYTIYESIAIVQQLLDEHSDRGLAPQPGSAQRAYYYQWCAFTAAELDPAVMLVFDNSMRPLEFMRPPGRQHNQAWAALGREQFRICADALADVLSERDYLLGEQFSGADIVVGHSCFMAEFTGLLDGLPKLQSYYQRLQQRPAYQRVYA